MFAQNIEILKIKNSAKRNSLGGNIAEEFFSFKFTFNEFDSILGNFQYKFFYLVNEFESELKVYKFRIEQYIDYRFHQDKFDAYLLKNINSEIVLTNFFSKNKMHYSYTELGEIVDFGGKNIEDFIIKTSKNIIIKEELNYRDFYPFAIRVSINNAIERVFNLPIILNIKAYLA